MIRWITSTLGTAATFSADIDASMAIVDVTDLLDKSGNSTLVVLRKLDQGVALLNQGRRVVVCCDYGISRSNAIAAGILARASKLSIDEAIKQVVSATGETEIKLEPLNIVRLALGNSQAQGVAVDERRILLTGGSGFIGQRLEKALATEYLVFAPSREDVNLLDGALSLDLAAKEHQFDCIVHLANPRVYTSNCATGQTITILKNVLDVCRENQVPLVYLSGWEVYSGYRAIEIIADEHLPLFPKGPYGEAKFLAEMLIEHHRKVYRLECALIRSSPVYGEGSERPKFIHNFISKARNNLTITTHKYLNGPPHLDLLYIDDLVSAMIAAIKKRYWETLNLGSGRCISTQEVGEAIIRKLNSKSVMAFHAVDDYAPNVRMDNTVASTQLSWKPTITLDTGLDRIIAESTKN